MGLPITNLKDEDYDSIGDSQTELSTSLKAKKIYTDAIKNSNIEYDLITYVTEWSDCFDPNTSSKNNRASVYVKSITFSRKLNSRYPAASYTFPICIGPGKKDKLHIEEKFAMELDQFKQREPVMIWDNSTRSFRKIYIDILCSMQDQPERRSGLCLMMGNSRMFPRIGYSCNYLSINTSLPSCTQCKLNLQDAICPLNVCTNCLNWELHTDNKLCHFKAPAYYPTDCPFLLDDNFLQPR